jgi:hypothetical protein
VAAGAAVTDRGTYTPPADMGMLGRCMMPQATDQMHAWERHQRMMQFLASNVALGEWTPGDRRSLPRQAGGSGLQALYINLDACTERRRRIEEQLTAFAIPYRRIRAVAEPYAPLGCLKSHVKALRTAARSNKHWTLILEDDFQFDMGITHARALSRFVVANSALAPVWLGAWEINGPEPLPHPEHHFAAHANGACTTTSCYFIRHDYIGVLLATWQSALERLVDVLMTESQSKLRDPVVKIRDQAWYYDADCAWAPLQGRDGWLLFRPALGYQSRERHPSVIVPAIHAFEQSGFRSAASRGLSTAID